MMLSFWFPRSTSNARSNITWLYDGEAGKIVAALQAATPRNPVPVGIYPVEVPKELQAYKLDNGDVELVLVNGRFADNPHSDPLPIDQMTALVALGAKELRNA
jgi:hypothetical protein